MQMTFLLAEESVYGVDRLIVSYGIILGGLLGHMSGVITGLKDRDSVGLKRGLPLLGQPFLDKGQCLPLIFVHVNPQNLLDL